MQETDSEGNPLYPLDIPEYGLTLLQDCGLGYAGYVWPGALSLCACLQAIHEEGSLAGANVLELGAGCGLAGIFAACCGAQVTLTDSEDALPLLRSNVTLNASCAPKLEVCALRFGGDAHHSFKKGAFNYIIASDVTYFQELQQALLATLLQLMDEKTVLVLTHGQRQSDVTQSLRQMMKTHFEVKEINLADLGNDWTTREFASRLSAFVKNAYGECVPVWALHATLRSNLLSSADQLAKDRYMDLCRILHYPMSSGNSEAKVIQSKDIIGFRSLRVSAAELVLSAYVEKMRSNLQGKGVLELQAGCGIVGLVAALAGAHVVLSDTREVLPHLRENINLNTDSFAQEGGSCKAVADDDLNTNVFLTEVSNGTVDFIIVSDITVGEDFQPLIPEVVEHLLTDKVTLILTHTDCTSEGVDFPWQHYKQLKEIQRKLELRFQVCVAATTDSVLRGKPELSEVWASSWAQEIYKERVGLPVTVFSLRTRSVAGDQTAAVTNAQGDAGEFLSSMD